jgi:hypothetical protein
MPITFCNYEDRPQDVIGIRLLVLSIERHAPGAHILLYLKNMPQDFLDWLAARPSVTLCPLPAELMDGWDIKPEILMDALQRRPGRVTWIDSDIVLTKPVAHFFDVADDVFVATEEAMSAALGMVQTIGSRFRALGNGLTPGRDIPVTINSCIVSLTEKHLPVLEAWKGLTRSPTYLISRKRHWTQAPLYMLGGQDLLTAVLGSTVFDGLTLKILASGRDIAQCKGYGGYSTIDRLGNLGRGLPPFVHAQGDKPWRLKTQNNLPLQISAYRFASAELAPHVTAADWPESERDWLIVRNKTARAIIGLCGGSANLSGLAPSIVAGLRAQMRVRFGVGVQKGHLPSAYEFIK